MTIGQIIDLIITLLVASLFGVISYLLKGRFDKQDKAIEKLGEDIGRVEQAQTLNTIAVAKLVESQRFMAQNQTTISHAQERLISEADDLEDINDQLQDATSSLRRRMDAHEEFHQLLAMNREERARNATRPGTQGRAYPPSESEAL